MRIAYLVPTIYGLGGTASAIATQANAMCRLHEVEILSVYRDGERPHYRLDPSIVVHDLVDLVRTPPTAGPLVGDEVTALRDREPLLIPPAWDPTLDALADVGLEEALPRVTADVLVTVTPALLALATQLVPAHTAVVHQEHRSSSQRKAGLEPLLEYARRADAVAMLTDPMARWLADELGPTAPEIVVMPNALPPRFRPRSLLDGRTIVAAGRMAGEKQFPQLIGAFARIVDRLPGWRLRIFGEGPARFDSMITVRKHGLWDRVEVPGPTSDLASEWARASISALSSNTEGHPLVLQEAMAAGVPVVSYDSPSGPRAIIDDGVDGLLVAQQSEEALAAALLRLATDDDLRHRLGDAAARKALEWDSAMITRQWAQIFERVLERRGDRPVGRATLRRTGAGPDSPPAGVTLPVPGVTPEQSRAAALEAAAAAAERSASGEWFVIPPHDRTTAVLVVPMDARRGFLDALAEAGLPEFLCLHDPEWRGWPARRGRPKELLPQLRRGRTARMLVEPWPLVAGHPSVLAQDCGVTVEFWEEGVDGELHTPGQATYAVRVPPGSATATATVHGREVPTHDVMVGPTPTECRFPVDVVYTWVDGTDPVWDAARRRRLADLAGSMLAAPSSGRARFMDRGELRWSMRSVHLFAPWVRRIHLVTAGQVPDWLDPDHPKIQLVDHREILPADALPTFNSHAIETALHRIPDLTEHFLYLNDDTFIGRPSRPERWFGPAGQTAIFPSSGVIGLPGQDDLPYLKAAANNRRLLQDAFGVTITRTFKHTPHPQRRSVLEEITARFPEELARTARAPFRSDTDVSLQSSLAQHYGLITGTAFVGETEYTIVNLGEPDVRRRLNGLLDRTNDCFCLGDTHQYARPPEVVAELVTATLETYFPIAAPWEIR